MEKILIKYVFKEGVWSAETKDFGIGYSHSDFKTARKVITDSVQFYYEDIYPEIEIIEVVPQSQEHSVI